jgi:putative hydrolase of the HAD superfamily
VSNFGIPECGRNLLERFGLEEYFDVVVISSEANRRKPSREIFQKALQAFCVAPSRAVFVGDMPDLDVKGLKNIRIKTVLIKKKPMKSDLDAKPHLVIKSLAELPAIL